jgi:hypothetical protein
VVPFRENKCQVSSTVIEISIGMIGEFKHLVHVGLNAHGEGIFGQATRGFYCAKRLTLVYSFAYRAVTRLIS